MPGITVSVIGADHQNKADVGISIARDWITNQAINVITDVPVSSAELAVAEATRGQPERPAEDRVHRVRHRRERPYRQTVLAFAPG